MTSGNIEILAWAHANAIDLSEMIEHHGIRFSLQLLKSLKKPKNAKFDTTDLIYPKSVHDIPTKESLSQYKDMVTRAGFKFHEWPYDFVDDDTGNVIHVTLWNMYYVGCDN